jgi:gamma-glutamyltranspeptidase/glutathione hydrolase
VNEARRFPSGCVASPHYLASAAGLSVLASGGNAVDAAVATNLALGVVTPYLCGFGGDLFALLWVDGQAIGYNGSGRAPGSATVEAVREAVGSAVMPTLGPHTVTVPGAVEGWFALLDRFGSRSFEDLSRHALSLADGGFPLTARAAQSLRRAAERYRGSREWRAIYGDAVVGGRLRQPDLARTIRELGSSGPDPYYQGPIARSIAAHVGSLGGFLDQADLADHRGDWIEPLRAGYQGVEILELPPNTQGVAALEALAVVEAAGPLPPGGAGRHHLLIEAVKLALADRDTNLTDPEHMSLPATELLTPAHVAERAASIDPSAAARPPAGRAALGGTAYMCAADANGMCVSLIQSNYMGFGSGVTVPGWGINLQNRGAYFSLDPRHVNVIAPRKRTLHTLIPAMALREGRPWLVFGTMGGDGQAQTHLQLLSGLVDDGLDPQQAVGAPRWMVSPEDWSVAIESRFDPGVVEGLEGIGHRLLQAEAFDSVMGHAHVIEVTGQGYAGGSDPRAEGAVLGL